MESKQSGVRQAGENLAGLQSAAAFSDEEVKSAVRERGSCLLCGAPLKACAAGLFDTRFGSPGSYDIHRCVRCGLEQIYPIPIPAELQELYETHYNFRAVAPGLYGRLRDWFLSSTGYRWWMLVDGDVSFHGRKGSGRLLDIGCNEGRGLRQYIRNGFTAEGLEVNPVAAQVAQRVGFTVHVGSLENFQPVRRFDVAVLSNVLEHSLDPKRMLQHVARILEPGGQVCISCPNSQSWLRGVFGRSWINWHVPFHISHFSAETLKNLLRETGFTNVEIQQISPAHWVVASLIVRVFAKKGWPTRAMRDPILVLALLIFVRFLFFPALWIGNWRGRGDCLLATASKA